MNEMHDIKEKRDHTRWRTQDLGRKSSGEGEEFEWEVFGRGRDVFLSIEIREKWEKHELKPIYRNHKAWWIQRCRAFKSRWIELSRSYREVSIVKEPRWIEKLSRRQKLSWWIKKLSRSYRNKFLKTSMDRNCDSSCRKSKIKSSIDSLAIERYQEAVEIA